VNALFQLEFFLINVLGGIHGSLKLHCFPLVGFYNRFFLQKKKLSLIQIQFFYNCNPV
jgi:hypothetical protein